MKKIYFFILLFLIGCGAPSNKTEDVFVIPIDYENNEIIPFSESGLKLSYELIPLYADTASFYAPLSGAQVKVYKDYFYLFNSFGQVRIFDKNGNFVKDFSKGKGPGEMEMRVSDLCFNGDTLSVFQLSKISYFDLRGNHIRDERKKENFMNYSDVYQFGDYRFIYSANDFENNFVQISDTKSKNIVAHAVSKKFLQDNNTENFEYEHKGVKVQMNTDFNAFDVPSTNNRFLECNGNLYFNIPMNDCIYRINKGDSIPYVYMKIGNLFSIENVNDMTISEMKEYPSKNKMFSNLFSLGVRDDGNLISFRLTKEGESYAGERLEPLSVMYDKKENKLYELPITNLLTGYPDGDDTYYAVAPEYAKYLEKKANELEKEILSGMEQGNEKIETYIIKVKINR